MYGLGGAYAFLAPSTYQSTSMLRIKQAQGLSNSVLSSALMPILILCLVN